MSRKEFFKSWRRVVDIVIVIFSYVLVFITGLASSLLLWLVDRQEFVETLSDTIRRIV